MKKIAVIAASGKAGSLIAEKAMTKGFEVVAIVRNKARLKVAVTEVIEKNIFDLTSEDLSGFDAVVLAYRAPEGNEAEYSKVAHHVTEILSGSTTRLIVVGGAGSLYLDESRTRRLVDELSKDLPYYPTIAEMGKASLIYKNSNVNVTFFSPADFFDPDGAETGSYTITSDIFEKNKSGKSRVSYADYADAVVNMIDKRTHQNEHIGIYEN
ncbi:MAG: NAD(P)H-binding protein [Streptococcaceae bacterium]|nr:NAD(P)H-binding protein [Streptococcaceae bacterium]